MRPHNKLVESVNTGNCVNEIHVPSERMNGSQFISQWRTHQLAQSLSKRTVSERVSTITRLGAWLGVDPAEASTDQIAEWLALGGEWKPSSRATYHGHLSAWFEWLLRMGHRHDDPMLAIGAPRRPRSQPHPVADEHMPRLLAQPMWPRTLVMILLASLAGLRVHEIAKVRGEDVDIIGRTLRVTGKGDHTATIPLHPLLVEAAERMPRKGWWFPSATKPGRPVLGQSVSIRIREVMVRAGVPGSAHSLRHWYGTTLVDSGADLRVAQELLRHASLATTQIYVRAADRRKVEGINRLDPWRGNTAA